MTCILDVRMNPDLLKEDHPMNTPNENTENTQTRTPGTGFWLRAIQHSKHEKGREYRATLNDKAREGISDEDYATTMATLEQMARNLGWDESKFEEHGFGHGFGPGFGHRGGPRGHRGGPRGFRGFDGPRGQRPDTLPNETPEA